MRKRYLTSLLFICIASACTKTPESNFKSTANDTETAAVAGDAEILATTATDEQNENDFATDASLAKVCIDKPTTASPLF